jgi:hypothetical protein
MRGNGLHDDVRLPHRQQVFGQRDHCTWTSSRNQSKVRLHPEENRLVLGPSI